MGAGGGGGGGFQPNGKLAVGLAGLATAISLAISAGAIYKHLAHYSVPRMQRYIVRILFVAPVYALGSLLSLRFPKASVGLETIRDLMEAFVVYSFLALVLEYAGGDSTCVNRIKQEPPLRHPFPLCCLAPIARDGRFLRLCKQGTLQFVGVKLATALATLVMLWRGQYHSPTYQALLLVVYNLSYSVALYCLALFYMGTRTCLQGYKPVAKFLSVKSIVFATYWQSLIVSLAVHKGGEDDAGASDLRASEWNNFILCLEMVPFSFFLGLAFSHQQYQHGIPDASVLSNIQEVLSVKDVVQDAVHSFMPSYTEYVLFNQQNNGGGSGEGQGQRAPPRKYKARTYLAGNLDRVSLRSHDQLEDDGEGGGCSFDDDVDVDMDDNQSLASTRSATHDNNHNSMGRRAPTTTSLGTIMSSGGSREEEEELGGRVTWPGGAGNKNNGGGGKEPSSHSSSRRGNGSHVLIEMMAQPQQGRGGQGEGGGAAVPGEEEEEEEVSLSRASPPLGAREGRGGFTRIDLS